MGFQGIPRTAAIAGAAVIAVAVVATSGIGQAAAADGPVLYLSNHGAPTGCHVTVYGTLTDGSPYTTTSIGATATEPSGCPHCARTPRCP